MAMHGMDRAAAEFRDVIALQSASNAQIVLVPEFDTHQFPDFYAYNFGGVRLPPPSNTVLPREQWNFGIVDRLFAHVRTRSARTEGLSVCSGTPRARNMCCGISRSPRLLLLTRLSLRTVGCMLPDLTAEYPIGMGGLDLDGGHLRTTWTSPCDFTRRR